MADDRFEVDFSGFEASEGDVAPVDFSNDFAGADFSAAYDPNAPHVPFKKHQDPNSFGSSLARGLANTQGNVYKFIEAFTEEMNADDYAEWARKKAQDAYLSAEKEGTPIAMKDVDITELGDVVDFVMSRTGEIIPTIAGIAVSAGGGAILGGAPGAMLGTAAFSGAQNVGDVHRTLEQRGVPEMDMSAWLLAGAMTATDTVGHGKVTGPLLKETAMKTVIKEGADATRTELQKKFLKNGVRKEVAHNLAVAGTAEAIASAATVGALELGTAAIADDEVNEDFLWQLSEAALLGGAAGTGFGSVGGYVKAKNLEAIIGTDATRKALRDSDIENQVVTQSDNPIIAAGQQLWKVAQGKPIDPVLHEITPAPSGRKIRVLFEKVLPKAIRDKTGDNIHKIEQIKRQAIEEYKGKKVWQDELLKDVKAGKKEGAAGAFRKMMDEDFKDSVRLGMVSKENYIDNYFAVTMDKDAILNNKEKFEAHLRKNLNDIDTTEGKKKLADYYNALETGNWQTFMNRIEKLTPEEIEQGKPRKGSAFSGSRVQGKHGNIEGHRVWKGGQDFYDTWSKSQDDGKNWWNNQSDYMISSAHRKAGVEVLGKNTENLNKLILETQNQLLNPEGDVAPTTLKPSTIDRFYKTVEAYNNTLNPIENKLYRNVASGVSTLANITALPLATLGSLTEPFNIAMKTDMGTFIRSQVSLLTGIGVNLASMAALRGPTQRHQTNATEMSMAGQTIASMDIATDARLTDNVATDWSTKVNRGFFRLNGLTFWTQGTRYMGAESARLVIQDSLKVIREMPNTHEADLARRRLTEMEIGPARYGLFDPSKNLTDAQKKQREAVESQAIRTFLTDVALEPNFAHRPQWMSDQKMWMFSKLLGYPTMFSNTVLPNLHKKFKGNVPHAVVDGLFIYGMIALTGGMQIGIRDIVSGREPFERQEEDLFKIGGEAIMRYGTPTTIQMMSSIVSGQSYGRSIADNFFGITGQLGQDAIEFTTEMVSGAGSLGDNAFDFLTTFTPARAFKKHFE